jgi:hypothetical protein
LRASQQIPHVFTTFCVKVRDLQVVENEKRRRRPPLGKPKEHKTFKYIYMSGTHESQCMRTWHTLLLSVAALAFGAVSISSTFAQDPPPKALVSRMNVGSVLGIEVRTDTERNVGRIIDLLAKPRGGVEAAVVEFGGFLGIGTRRIAVEWSALRFDKEANKLVATIDIPRDQLRAAPDYRQDQPVVVRTVQPTRPTVEEPPVEPQPPFNAQPKARSKPEQQRRRRQID